MSETPQGAPPLLLTAQREDGEPLQNGFLGPELFLFLHFGEKVFTERTNGMHY